MNFREKRQARKGLAATITQAGKTLDRAELDQLRIELFAFDSPRLQRRFIRKLDGYYYDMSDPFWHTFRVQVAFDAAIHLRTKKSKKRLRRVIEESTASTTQPGVLLKSLVQHQQLVNRPEIWEQKEQLPDAEAKLVKAYLTLTEWHSAAHIERLVVDVNAFAVVASTTFTRGVSQEYRQHLNDKLARLAETLQWLTLDDYQHNLSYVGDVGIAGRNALLQAAGRAHSLDKLDWKDVTTIETMLSSAKQLKDHMWLDPAVQEFYNKILEKGLNSIALVSFDHFGTADRLLTLGDKVPAIKDRVTTQCLRDLDRMDWARADTHLWMIGHARRGYAHMPKFVSAIEEIALQRVHEVNFFTVQNCLDIAEAAVLHGGDEYIRTVGEQIAMHQVLDASNQVVMESGNVRQVVAAWIDSVGQLSLDQREQELNAILSAAQPEDEKLRAQITEILSQYGEGLDEEQAVAWFNYLNGCRRYAANTRAAFPVSARHFIDTTPDSLSDPLPTIPLAEWHPPLGRTASQPNM